MTTGAQETVTAEGLFERLFLPLYPESATADLARARQTDANPARNPTIFAHLEEAADLFVKSAPRTLGANLDLDYSDASVHRLSASLTREKRDAWARAGAPGTSDNELFNVVVHGAAYVGACIVRGHGGTWSARSPLWESLVDLSSRAGEAKLAVFHWWLKSLGDSALASAATASGPLTLADRYRTHVEIPRAQPENLPVFIVGARNLPRLSKVRYAMFHKYIKANLPELRDLGAHFPSPERFEELSFKWIDFRLLGDGRMVLLVGLTEHGAHLMWLDSAGFIKSAFYPAEKFPEPVVRIADEKIQLLVSLGGKTLTHEMLWWGP